MKLRLATRKSKLALAQARAYAATVVAHEPGLEIEEALLDGRADFAVHSIKDVPAELAPGLLLASIPPREDARDVLVVRGGGGLAALPQRARVGTSSLRRKCYLLGARPDLDVSMLRGNVDTRLRKLDEGQVEAIVLAAAGLRRLGIALPTAEALAPELCLPAVGQGALGIECRSANEAVAELLSLTEDASTRIRVTAERAVMASVGGSCHLPVAAFAVREGEDLWLRAMVAEPDGSRMRTGERRAPWPAAPADAEALGRALGDDLATA